VYHEGVYRFLIEILFWFYKDPESVHRLSLRFLQVVGHEPFRSIVSGITEVRLPLLGQDVWGLYFKNPVGLAGGFDKNGEAILGLEALGFGFIEAGSVTWHAQQGNPRQRIFRFPQDLALINRMGFNNAGAEALKANLEKLRDIKVPLGISLGKSKITELKDAAVDYLASFKTLCRFGDYFVINVSSPNTPGLRQLQDKDFLIGICNALNGYRVQQETRKPILVKIAPDLTNEAIDDVLAVVKECSLDGIIATNTTISREGLSVQTDEAGGLSGKPVRKRATEIIRYIHSKNPTLPIIGVGGIFTAEDAYEKIKAGASLVQIYTGFIYGGPMTVSTINRGLARLLKRDGFRSIREAVGSETKNPA
jgi:dihydroorotate dehydrogenase